MRINRYAFISFLLGTFFLFVLHAEADQALPFDNPDSTISLDFQSANLNDILKILSIQSGLNFIASEAVKDRKITLYLDKVSIKEAIDKLFKANNLSYELDKHSNIFIVKDWGKPQIETITKVFSLKYATVSSSSLESEKGSQSSDSTGGSGGAAASGSESGLTSIVTKNLSEYGKVIEDKRTNSLVVTEIPSRMPVIQQIIASLDLPQPQIMLEVEMLDVSKGTVDKMGVNWPEAIASLDVTGARVTNFPFFGNKANQDHFNFEDVESNSGLWKFSEVNGNHFTPSIFTFIGANLTLDFLRKQSDTKQLARPRILTLNNETAEIRITTQEAISVTSTSVTGQSQDSGTSISNQPIREETGVSLRVTPQVNVASGEITMCIVPKVKATSASALSTSLNPIKDPEERSTKSVVRIKDGETVVLGGLIKSDFAQEETKLPILGDIPIIGAAFRHKNKDKDSERELLVFITPHIISDSKAEPAQMNNTAQLDREQNDMTMFDRFATMDDKLNDFEKTK